MAEDQAGELSSGYRELGELHDLNATLQTKLTRLQAVLAGGSQKIAPQQAQHLSDDTAMIRKKCGEMSAAEKAWNAYGLEPEDVAKVAASGKSGCGLFDPVLLTKLFGRASRMVWTRVDSAAKSALFRDIPRQNRALKARNCDSTHSAPRGIEIPRIPRGFRVPPYSALGCSGRDPRPNYLVSQM